MAEGVSPTVARRQARLALPVTRGRDDLTDLPVITETSRSLGVVMHTDPEAGAIQRAHFPRVRLEAADEETRSPSLGQPWKTATEPIALGAHRKKHAVSDAGHGINLWRVPRWTS
ncbi:hypothetical protein GCM10023107_37380 [Actinoplanes octamycinicus]|nr:hypothetical protein Aoc01nite_30580 [Actinoplanes octamycinicus]